MRHAVLGAGGVGGLIAAALARSGEDVLLLLRPETLAAYGGRLRLESVVLGDAEVDVPAAPRLDGGVDVLWVTTKATQLEEALALAPPEAVADAFVVALLNGVDHVDVLRRRYPNVVGAAIRVESERVRPGLIRQTSPFLVVDVAGAEPVQAALRRAGVDCRSRDDERVVLWEKLVALGPLALATTAFDAPFGDVRADRAFVACREEALEAARTAGAAVDEAAVLAFHEAAPDAMRTSMQKDVAAGRVPELDAIAGPIRRAGRAGGFATPATDGLVERILSRT